MANVPAVLIVEDDIATGHLLETLLRRSGLHTALAADGEAALQSMQSFDYDVILLDLLLPKVDGKEILRRVSLATPHLLHRIIVVTAAGPAEYWDCEPIRSVWSVMRKPFELAVLERHVFECCGERQRDAARLAAPRRAPAETA